MRVDPLVLRPGDRAETVGTIIRVAGGFGVVYDLGPGAVRPDMVYPADAPDVVAIRRPAGRDHTAEGLLGRRAAVIGGWRDGSLHAEQVQPVEGSPSPAVVAERTPSKAAADAAAQVLGHHRAETVHRVEAPCGRAERCCGES